ncbi:hypothetical protein CROQUDRAFT_35062, partial [Cronartium quercuum f. sp. fusiforme G11]
HEDTLVEADQEIQRIVAGLPPSLREVPDYNISPEERNKLPSYVPQLRHFLQISCAHKRLVIHRAFLNHINSVTFTKSGCGQGIMEGTQLNQKNCSSSPFATDAEITHLNSQLFLRRCKTTLANMNRKSAIESKAICIKLARKITREIVQATREFEERPTWSTPYIAVGAITLLSLDLLEMCAICANALRITNKRSMDHDCNGTGRSESPRPWKHLKRCPNQTCSDLEESNDAGRSRNQEIETNSLTEVSCPPEVRTDEEIKQKKEVRRRELEQGLAALEKLSSWSPIAERGVTLVRSLLSQKDPLNTLINPENNRLDYELSCHRLATLPKITNFLTTPTTKIVARQDLKSAEKLGPSTMSNTRLENETRLENRAGINQDLAPIHPQTYTHAPPLFSPSLKSSSSFPYSQVTSSCSLQPPSGLQYSFSASYNSGPTQYTRSSQTPDVKFSPNPSEYEPREFEPQIPKPGITSISPKYIDMSSQLYLRQQGSPFQQIDLPRPQPSTGFDDDRNPQSILRPSPKTSEPQQVPEQAPFPITQPLPPLPPPILVNTPNSIDENVETNRLNFVESRPSTGWEMSEYGVPYDYIESLLHSSFGLYAAPIDFDALFSKPA